jgi:hypothetical protein
MKLTIMNLQSNLSKARKLALNRDNYTCQHCGTDKHDPSSRLTIHHLKSRRYFPELAKDVDNLITLCYDCHKAEEKRLYLACDHEQSGPYVMTQPRLIANCSKCHKLYRVANESEEARLENGC